MTAILLPFLLTVYAACALMIVIGIVRESGRRDFSSARPFVSIIIPVRNEERNIRACLESVLTQTYPRASYEVILVNDNSTDKTATIAAEVAKRFSNLRLFDVPENSDRVGKLVALEFGIKQSTGELILLTDGDITVQSTWVEQVVRHAPADVGIAGGLTLPKSDSIVAKMQLMDWTFLLGIACGAIGIKRPLSIIANNFALRRAAHDEVGGFASVRNSVDDDFLMFKDVVGKTNWGYRFILHPDCVNETLPCGSIREAFNQKHRWGRGGFGVNPFGYLLILASVFTHWVLFAETLITPATAIPLWVIKCVADAGIILATLSVVRRVSLFKNFLLFQVYYLIYIFVMPFRIAFVRDVEWKGRVYKKVV